VGSADKVEFCKGLGADLVINYKDDDFETVILDKSDGVDVVLDIVAGDYVQKNINVLQKNGRLVIIGLLGGPKAEVNILPILGKRLTITGSLLRPQTLEQKQAIRDSLLAKVWPLIENKTIKPIIDSQIPFKQAAKAHELMESSAHMGKIVLLMD
jgi:NADPH:quinone reductase-like Zn-dependent oxidoreductase